MRARDVDTRAPGSQHIRRGQIVHKQLMTGLAISGLWAASAQAVDITANGGWNSEYIFRGVPQADSSPFVGADIEHAGFFAGIWGSALPDDMRKTLKFLEETMRGLRRAMREHPCDSPLIRKLDENMIRMYARKQPR